MCYSGIFKKYLKRAFRSNRLKCYLTKNDVVLGLFASFCLFLSIFLKKIKKRTREWYCRKSQLGSLLVWENKVW